MTKYIVGILILVIGFIVYKLIDKKIYIRQINLLQEEVNSKMGSFIKRQDRTRILGKAELLKEIAIRRKYSFDESAMFITYTQNLKQMIYENNLSVLENGMESCLEMFRKRAGDAKEYITTRNIKLYAEQFQDEMKRLANDSMGYSSPIIEKCLAIYSDPEQYLLKLNDIYMEEEKAVCHQMFDNFDGKSLDINQRNAVVNDDLHQLVIAGAGSGKTLTVSAKVKYLIERKGINPKDILLISFTRKAADEMAERIQKLGIDIETSTFHKYGLKVIRTVNKKAPDVAEDIGKYINMYLKEVVYNDNKLAKDFLVLLGTLMLPVFDGYQTIGERIEAEQRQDLTTIKGMYEAYSNKVKSEKVTKKIDELSVKIGPLSDKLKQLGDVNASGEEYIETQKMLGLLENEIYALKLQKRSIRNETLKSAEEVMLANIFFLDGVEYEYETEYPYDEVDNYRKKYRPDFYIKESDVYWEHFGTDERNRAQQYSHVAEQQYLDSIGWKRNIHQENKTKLAETYSWQFRKNQILDAVNKNYIKFGIKKQEVHYCDVIREILKGDAVGNIESFKTLLSTFISLFKSYGYSIKKFDELRKDIAAYKDENLSKDALERRKSRDLLFLDFAEKFYGFYGETLIEEEKIDFNDMIIQATEHIRRGTYIPNYRYVIVDEYQDISVGRYQLIKETLEKAQAKLFCVGDDWQSIYRFTGSEVDLLVNFQKYFGMYSGNNILQTYRNSQELLDISGNFIMANTYQNPKQLRSNKHLDYPIRLCWYTGSYRPILENEEDEIEIQMSHALREAVGAIVKKFPNGEILLLGRNNSDLNYLSNDKGIKILQHEGETQVVLDSFTDVKIKFLTVHRAKGLEADNVIILNAKNARSGFPNQIVDDPILNFLRETKETYAFAEERRLFYVALTRTKNYTYILAPMTQASRFLDEIKMLDETLKTKGTKYTYPKVTRTKGEEKETSPVLSCPICKVGTLVKRIGAEGKEFVSCSNYPACNYTVGNLDVVRQNNRCPVCDNFLVKRKGIYGDFMGCMSYPHCTYSADIVIENVPPTTLANEQKRKRMEQYASRFAHNNAKDCFVSRHVGWTLEEDYQLKGEFEAKKSITEIARIHQRSNSEVSARLKKIGLID